MLVEQSVHLLTIGYNCTVNYFVKIVNKAASIVEI